MIKYMYGTELCLHSNLAQTMFTDRAKQFSERLGWPVKVDMYGHERDQYDSLNPIYVIVEDECGRHAGSMRLMPTMGRTMINEHFASSHANAAIVDPTTWECTRFCLSPSAGPRVAIKLFASAGYLMREFDICSLVAVFDHLMFRKYRISGVAPVVIGERNIAKENVIVGRWSFCPSLLRDLTLRSALDRLEYELALTNAQLSIGPQNLVA